MHDIELLSILHSSFENQWKSLYQILILLLTLQKLIEYLLFTVRYIVVTTLYDLNSNSVESTTRLIIFCEEYLPKLTLAEHLLFNVSTSKKVLLLVGTWVQMAAIIATYH